MRIKHKERALPGAGAGIRLRAMFDFDPVLLVLIAAVFTLAGTVKGVIGLGMPSVAMGLLTALIGLPQAMVLLLVPTFLTNVWQACSGGNGLVVLKRIWPFLAMGTVTVWLGALALTRIDTHILSGMLGLSLASYALINLAGYRIAIPATREGWLGPVLGGVNGVLTGMTGSSVIPGVVFLQAIGLPRDQLIQAMGMLFTLSTLALGLALQGAGFLSQDLGMLSVLALVPAIGGMMIGTRIRTRLSEAQFRRVFFCALLLLGLYILIKAVT